MEIPQEWTVGILAIIGVIGVVCLIKGVLCLLDARAFMRRSEQTDGVVVDHKRRSDAATQAPIIEYTVDGHTYRFTRAIYTSGRSHHIGDTIRVRYDSRRPGSAQVDGFLDHHYKHGILLSVGVGFIFGAIVNTLF